MIRFISRRILWMLLVLFIVSVITFMLMHAVPGGPFDREKALPAQIQANLNEKYNLDDPLHVQYVNYVGDILLPQITTERVQRSTTFDHLFVVPLPFLGEDATFRWMNFGPSYKSRSRTVNDIFEENLPVSAQLGLAALAVAICIGVPLGTLAALNRNTRFDYAAMGIAILGVSVPVIVLGPILRYVVGVEWGILPVTGWGTWQHMVLPAFALGFAQSALLARLTRASLLQTLNDDYVRTARAKGLAETRVVIGHVMKNALIPVITIIGPLFAVLITGTFVTEQIFGIPGLGKYFITSVTNRDYPVIMGTILLFAFFLVVANMLVDVMYAWLDPRIRYE